MQCKLIKLGTSRVLLTVLLVLFLSACGGGGGGGDGGGGSALSSEQQSVNSTSQQPAAPSAQEDLTQGSTGSFDLKWAAPVSRTDGSSLPLSEINGFTVYYGKLPGKYTYYADVSDGTAQNVTVTDVPVGTYYVVMTTYDNNGRESGYSSMVTKAIL